MHGTQKYRVVPTNDVRLAMRLVVNVAGITQMEPTPLGLIHFHKTKRR